MKTAGIAAVQSVDHWMIEDNHAFRNTVARLLNQTTDIRCTRSFPACEDALALLNNGETVDVMLLDVELAGMNGIEGLKKIKALSPGTRVIMLTVFEDHERVFRAICAGAAGYMLKTATTDEIAAALRIAASGGSPINPRIARRVLEMFSHANPPQRDYGLSPREREILQLLVQGRTIKEAAAELGIGFYTADEYIRGVYEKLQVKSRGSAIAKALNERIVPPQRG